MTDARPVPASSPVEVPPAPRIAHMAWIPCRTFLMGSDHFYPEEQPAHSVSIDGFWMDRHPVTNEEFRRFVHATGYVTVAERTPNPCDYPGADPAALVPGSLVLRRPARRVSLAECRAWWAYL